MESDKKKSDKAARLKGRQPCSFPGCSNLVHAYGHCAGHAKQKRLGQELKPLREPRPDAAEGYHWCSKCKQFRPDDDFGWDKVRQELKRICLPCANQVQKDYAQRHAERLRVERQLRRFALTADQYNSLLEVQNGRCAICGGESKGDDRNSNFAVDHDHATGAVRGLLCGLCNRGLGQLRDDIGLLEAAIAYLKDPPFCKIPR